MPSGALTIPAREFSILDQIGEFSIIKIKTKIIAPPCRQNKTLRANVGARLKKQLNDRRNLSGPFTALADLKRNLER
jgi:hypothetical protein